MFDWGPGRYYFWFDGAINRSLVSYHSGSLNYKTPNCWPEILMTEFTVQSLDHSVAFKTYIWILGCVTLNLLCIIYLMRDKPLHKIPILKAAVSSDANVPIDQRTQSKARVFIDALVNGRKWSLWQIYTILASYFTYLFPKWFFLLRHARVCAFPAKKVKFYFRLLASM